MDAEVTAFDSNIALCTIRCEFNWKSKWRTWNRKHLKLTLQMEYMWNFNGIRISFALNNIMRRMLVQNDVRVSEKSKMAAWSGCRYEITYISACTHDSNKIPTAIPMFSMSSIFDFSLTPTHGTVQISSDVLSDIENIDIATEISLISCLYKLSYTLFHIHFRLQVAMFDILLKNGG